MRTSVLRLEDVNWKVTISVPEAADLLGIGRSAAYDAVRRGDVPSVRVGRRVLVPVAPLLDLLQTPRRGERDDGSP